MKLNKSFFTELFCIHIWKTTEKEKLSLGDPYWVRYVKHQVCIKCNKKKYIKYKV